jgi:hypothetical protein
MFTPSQIVSELSQAVSALNGVVGNLAGSSAGVSSSTINLIQSVLAETNQMLQALSKQDSSESEATLVRRIGADLTAVLTALAALPLPPQAVLPVRIASMIVPLIVSAADMIWPEMPSPKATRLLLHISSGNA